MAPASPGESGLTDLPPRGEPAFAVVPMVAVVLQWKLLGLLIGLWREFGRCGA